MGSTNTYEITTVCLGGGERVRLITALGGGENPNGTHATAEALEMGEFQVPYGATFASVRVAGMLDDISDAWSSEELEGLNDRSIVGQGPVGISKLDCTDSMACGKADISTHYNLNTSQHSAQM